MSNFQQVQVPQLRRSSFRRNATYKTTMNAGYLYPFYFDEVLPGDTFNVNARLFARLSTPIVPIMDNIYLETFFFYVPSRLVWEHFVNLMGEKASPKDTTQYEVPQVDAGTDGFAVGSLADYFGLPVNIPHLSVNALPFRIYNLCYNEWFRDENLIDPVDVPMDETTHQWTDKDNENSSDGKFVLRKRGKRFDYFTSCLPIPQRGPSVDLPLTGYAPVIGNGTALGLTDGTSDYGTSISSDYRALRPTTSSYGVSVGESVAASSQAPANTTIGLTEDPENSGLVADLGGVNAVTINTMRYAFMLQQLLERDNRGGTRYRELVLSHFGCAVPDLRLQRPEFLGGSSGVINMSAVPQTSSTNDVTPQGNLAAMGVYGDEIHGFSKSFDEHGYVIGLVNIRADLTYQQGVERMWNRKTRYDFYWPELAHLGEQEVLNKEIYAQGPDVVDDSGNSIDEQVFGYQERYAEYRYKTSLITGKLRSGTGNSLDVWHLGQYFENLPTLSQEFIEDNPPIGRALAVPSEPWFVFDSYLMINSVRPMPVKGVPGFQGHF